MKNEDEDELKTAFLQNVDFLECLRRLKEIEFDKYFLINPSEHRIISSSIQNLSNFECRSVRMIAKNSKNLIH